MMSTSCILIAGFFSRRISEATVRQDVRVRADAASKNTFRRDSVIPKWKKVMTTEMIGSPEIFASVATSITTARTSLGSKEDLKRTGKGKSYTRRAVGASTNTFWISKKEILR